MNLYCASPWGVALCAASGVPAISGATTLAVLALKRPRPSERPARVETP